MTVVATRIIAPFTGVAVLLEDVNPLRAGLVLPQVARNRRAIEWAFTELDVSRAGERAQTVERLILQADPELAILSHEQSREGCHHFGNIRNPLRPERADHDDCVIAEHLEREVAQLERYRSRPALPVHPPDRVERNQRFRAVSDMMRALTVVARDDGFDVMRKEVSCVAFHEAAGLFLDVGPASAGRRSQRNRPTSPGRRRTLQSTIRISWPRSFPGAA